MSTTRRDLITHSSDIVIGTVDIRTRNVAGTDYTMVTTRVLKGDLAVPALIVIRQDAAVAPLDIGASYLLFLRFDPQVMRYLVVTAIATDSFAFTTVTVEGWTRQIALAACAWDDVVVWNGTIYARERWNTERRFVPRASVGAGIGQVAIHDTSATACRTDLENGTASQSAPGRKIQRLKGTDPGFRIVIQDGQGKRRLYQALVRPVAKTGSDLLDPGSGISAVSLSEVCSETVTCDVTQRPLGDVAALKKMLLTSTIQAGAPFTVTDGYQLTMVLENGSLFVLLIGRDDGVATNGMVLPLAQLDRLTSTGVHDDWVSDSYVMSTN